MKLFIDTNWFLGLYAAPRARLHDLDRLQAIAQSVVLTGQSRPEFHRNRRNEIQKVIDVFKAPGFGEAPCLPTREAWEAARNAKQAFDQERQRVVQQLELARDDIRADEIGRKFYALSEACRIAPVTDLIMARAEARKQRGDPPKGQGATIGDEIHWEALLEWTRSPQGEMAHHLAILTGDRGFIDNEQFVREELLERARRDVVISSDLTVLLDAMTKDAAPTRPDDKTCLSCGGTVRPFPSGKPTTEGMCSLCYSCGQTNGQDILA